MFDYNLIPSQVGAAVGYNYVHTWQYISTIQKGL